MGKQKKENGSEDEGDTITRLCCGISCCVVSDNDAGDEYVAPCVCYYFPLFFCSLNDFAHLTSQNFFFSIYVSAFLLSSIHL